MPYRSATTLFERARARGGTHRRRSAVLLLVTVASFAVGCDTTSDTPPPTSVPESAEPAPETTTTDGSRGAGPDVAAVGEDLCRLAALAREEPAQAASMFDHGPIHPIADDLTQTDPTAAARLLEAKAAAKAAVRQDEVDGSELSAVLAELAGRLPDHPGCEPSSGQP